MINLGTENAPDFVLAGIVSSGTRVNNPLCAVAEEYGLYSDVKSNIAWIDNALNESILPNSAIRLSAVVLSAIAIMLVVT